LLFTLPAEKMHIVDELPVRCTLIGEVTPHWEGRRLLRENGEEFELTEWGYEHFIGEGSNERSAEREGS
jgi:hypothetical protein